MTTLFISGLLAIALFAVLHYLVSTNRQTRRNRRNRGSIFALGFLLLPFAAQAQIETQLPPGNYTVETRVGVGLSYMFLDTAQCQLSAWIEGEALLVCDNFVAKLEIHGKQLQIGDNTYNSYRYRTFIYEPAPNYYTAFIFKPHAKTPTNK